MIPKTYSQEEVNNIVKKEVMNVKNELIQYINELENKNKLLEESIEKVKHPIVNPNNNQIINGQINGQINNQIINEKFVKELGLERKYWFGLMTYISLLRTNAKNQVQNNKDSYEINEKLFEIFNEDIQNRGKDMIIEEIKYFYNKSRGKTK